MSAIQNLQHQGSGIYAPLLEKKPEDPVVKGLRDEISYLEDRFSEKQELLGLSRQERFDRLPRLQGECYARSCDKYDQGIKWLSIGCGVAGAAAFIGGLASGMSFVALRAIGHAAVILPLLAVPKLLGYVADKWLIPRTADRYMKEVVRQESRDLKTDIERARASLKKRESEIAAGMMNEIAQRAADAGSNIQDAPGFILVDGVRLGKNEPSLVPDKPEAHAVLSHCGAIPKALR